MTRPLLIALGCAVAALLVLGGLWRWEHGKAVRAGQERDAAVSQAELAQATVQTVERYHTTETVIRETAAPAIEQIQLAEGADAPLPDELLSQWRATIVGVRDAASTPHDPSSAAP